MAGKINTRAKGFRREIQAEQILLKKGWIAQRVKGSTLYNKNVDFYGLWDIIAMKPRTENEETQVLHVQVKSNTKPPLKEYEEFADIYRADNIKYQVWVIKDRIKGVDIYEC